MSSALLYLAIIAIWAGVLIPRWLRRDPARGAAIPDRGTTAEGDVPDALPGDDDPDVNAATDDITPDDDADDLPHLARAPLGTAESRRRMLAGRRRLLGMLVILETAAITLAALRLAAIWVLIPPSVMLAGYLMLLREAAHADAERAARQATATADRARARAQARMAAQASRLAQRDTPASGTPIAPAAPTAAELAAKFAAAPVPADYEDSGPGRDFAPGLAGKYTTSNAHAHPGDESGEDCEQPRLRVVGD